MYTYVILRAFYYDDVSVYLWACLYLNTAESQRLQCKYVVHRRDSYILHLAHDTHTEIVQHIFRHREMGVFFDAMEYRIFSPQSTWI